MAPLDAMPIPTLVIDPLYLGGTVGVVLLALIAASAVAVAVLRIRRGAKWRGAVGAGCLVWIVLDIICFGIALAYRERPERPDDMRPYTSASARASSAPASSAVPSSSTPTEGQRPH